MRSLLLGANVTDRRFLRYFLVFLLVGACAVGGVFLAKAWRARSKRLSLYAAAQPFFDANYYRTTYALGALGDQQAFEHYMTQGYKDLRNPSADFDATFYERLYLADYAGKVHGARQNPLRHYVRCGKAKGALMHPKFIKKAVPLLNPKYYLCVAAIFRDEARFLKEWIEYYLMMGVEHFYLTNHLSEDNYMEVLQPYIDKGLVTLRHETRETTNDYYDWRHIQDDAYRFALEETRTSAEWLLVVDTDEFIVPLKQDRFVDCLPAYDQFASVGFHWKTFGAGGVTKIKRNELLLEKLTKCADQNDMVNNSIKSVFKPRYVRQAFSVCHCPRLLKGFLPVGADKKAIPAGGRVEPVLHKVARVYHYRLRDLKFCREIKVPRFGKFTDGSNKKVFEGLWSDLEHKDAMWSVCDDKTMMRFVPELKRRMGLGQMSVSQDKVTRKQKAVA